MTGSFVLLVGNGRLSQTINHYLEARTNGRRLFRSLKPSAINFPSQVHVDRPRTSDSPNLSQKGPRALEFPTERG